MLLAKQAGESILAIAGFEKSSLLRLVQHDCSRGQRQFLLSTEQGHRKCVIFIQLVLQSTAATAEMRCPA
jgi:hypothetical protein